MISNMADLVSFRWATVRGINPISIQLDGDPAPLALIPDTLIDPKQIKVNDRVRVEMSLRKVVIHGKSNGFPAYVPPEPVPTSGLSTARPASPGYWQRYFETDTNRMLVGSKTGTWRRLSGSATNPARAWDTTATNLAGRTDTFTLPTFLEATEELMVWPINVGNGFGFITLAGLVRNSADTVATVRFMQILSLNTQPLTIGWQISPSST